MEVVVFSFLLILLGVYVKLHTFTEPRMREWFGKREFQIVQNEYFRQGSIIKVEYYIQERCKIFGNTKWVDVTELCCDWGDCYEVAVTFETKEEAQAYVDKICSSDIWKGTRQTVVDNHKC